MAKYQIFGYLASVACSLTYAEPIYFLIRVGKVEVLRHPFVEYKFLPAPFILLCKVNFNFSFLDGIHSSRPLLLEPGKEVPQSAENPQLPIYQQQWQTMSKIFGGGQ